MNSKLNRLLAMGIVAASLAGVQSAFAGAWSNSNGASAFGHFTWSDGEDQAGLFGDPIYSFDVVEQHHEFSFIFGSFSVSDDDNTDLLAASISDTLSWNMHLGQDFHLESLQIIISGTYAVSGATSEVNLIGDLSATEIATQGSEPGPRSTSSDFFNDNFPLDGTETEPDGSYTSIAEIQIPIDTPLWDNDLHISFENMLTAFAEAGGNASITQEFQEFEMTIVLIPEPATLGLIGLGAIALLRRRR